MSLAPVILIAAVALVVYMFATADNQYVMLKDRPKPWVPKRKSINYYAWRGPFFVEDFHGGAGNTSEAANSPQNTADCNQYNPDDSTALAVSCPCNSSGFSNDACVNSYVATGAAKEHFGNFSGENNPKAEIVPTCGACEVPKYNTHVRGARECHVAAKKGCRIPTLTAEQGWYNEYWNSTYRMEGPDRKLGTPGNYAQITNNNLDAPNNLESAQMRSWMGDWFCPRDKVSPYCYANKYRQCMASV